MNRVISPACEWNLVKSGGSINTSDRVPMAERKDWMGRSTSSLDSEVVCEPVERKSDGRLGVVVMV